MIVVDASALVEQLLATPKGLKLHQRCLIDGESLHAPHLLDLEVVNVLRRYWQRDILSISRADQALEDLLVFPLTRYAHEMFLPRIWELRDNMTPYDAAYVPHFKIRGNPPAVQPESDKFNRPWGWANK